MVLGFCNEKMVGDHFWFILVSGIQKRDLVLWPKWLTIQDGKAPISSWAHCTRWYSIRQQGKTQELTIQADLISSHRDCAGVEPGHSQREVGDYVLWRNSIKVLLYTKLKQNELKKKKKTYKKCAWSGINISFRSGTLIWNNWHGKYIVRQKENN